MKTRIIYHSYSGTTRGIAEKIRDACGGNLVDVKLIHDYSALTAYTLGCYRAAKGVCDPIEQNVIDVSADDVLVIGTPVWAGRATPAVNASVEALTGCKGKKAVIFATCKGGARETLPLLKRALAEKGVTVVGEFVFTTPDLTDPAKISALVSAIKAEGSTS